MPEDFYAVHADRVTLRVKAKPGARQDAVLGVRSAELVISVRVPAEKGRANDEIVRVLSRALGLPRAQVRMKLGGASAHKVFELPLAAAGPLERLRRKPPPSPGAS